MSIPEDLDKIDRTVKDLEIRLSGIRTNIDQIEKEISVLSPKKSSLEQNLRFQKKLGVVPIAHEYKKTRTEFNRIQNRLNLVITEQNKVIALANQIESMIEKLKLDQTKLIYLMNNNVINVDFGVENGKE